MTTTSLSTSQPAPRTSRRSPVGLRLALAAAAAALALSALAAGPLVLSPTSALVAAGGTVTFSASGGSGGYKFALTVNESGGSISGSGKYTAGAKGGVSDEVTVTDSAGASVSVLVTVGGGLGKTSSPDLGGHR
jgi:hypothetical protein